MLSRYRIHRGKRPVDDPLPDGVRHDTRRHTRHVLRPPAEAVARYLHNPTPAGWRAFKREYEATLERRFAEERPAFDRLAEEGRNQDVYLGCNCPTRKNPDVRHCHTWLALLFMRARYPDLEVVLPEP